MPKKELARMPVKRKTPALLKFEKEEDNFLTDFGALNSEINEVVKKAIAARDIKTYSKLQKKIKELKHDVEKCEKKRQKVKKRIQRRRPGNPRTAS